MALPGREAADVNASPGKIRRVINFFKSPFTRNKATGALETPEVVDVAARAQPKQESLLGEDPADLLSLGSADDDLMASLRKRVAEGSVLGEEGDATEGDAATATADAPAPKLYDRRRSKARPSGVAPTGAGGVAGTVLERPGSTSAPKAPKSKAAGEPRVHKPTGRMAKDYDHKKGPASTSKKSSPSASAKPKAKPPSGGADLDLDSVASNSPTADQGGAGEAPAMASAADIERLNKLFGMGGASE